MTTETNETKFSLKELIRNWRTLPATLKLLFSAAPGAATALFAVQLTWGLLPVVEIKLGKRLFDAVQASLLGNATDVVTPLLWLLGVLFAARIGMGLFDLIDIRFRTLVNLRIQASVMEKAMSVDLAKRENGDFQNLIEKISNGSWRITQMVFALAACFGDTIAVVALAATLASFSPIFVVLFTLTKFVQAWIGSYMNSIAWKMLEGNAEEARRSRMLFDLAIHKEAAKEIRLFGLSGEIVGRYRKILEMILEQDTSRLKIAAALLFLVDGISVGLYGLVYWVIVRGVVGGMLTLGDMALYTTGFLKLESSMRGVAWSLKQVDEGLRYYRSVHELFSTMPSIGAGGKRAMPKRAFDIVFDDVGFRYPGSDRWAIRHVSFEIKAGERIGLVGENGAGKTTLLKLLTHLYEATEGRILIDGIDYREYAIDELRRAITVVFQDFARFEMSAKDNISFGDVQKLAVDAEVKAVAELAGIAPVIERLPKEYETVLTTGWSSGTELSGGEWQKMALARALYRKEAGLVVLDEPTSAFDAKAEFEFFQEFLRIAKEQGKSALIVSHRFSNIRIADRIIVLQDGKVSESGTHEALMAKKGLYAELYAIQKESLA